MKMFPLAFQFMDIENTIVIDFNDSHIWFGGEEAQSSQS